MGIAADYSIGPAYGEDAMAPAAASAGHAGVATSAAGQTIGADPGAGLVRLPGHTLELPVSAIPGDAPVASPLTDVTRSEDSMTLTLVLKRDRADEFEHYLKDRYDPHSKHYRRFLTQAQLTRRFGPSRATVDEVASYLRGKGLAISEIAKNHLTLTVRGTRAAVEQAFAVRILDYKLGGVTFFANSADPAVPAALASHILAISGLSDYARPRNSAVVLSVFCVAIASLLFVTGVGSLGAGAAAGVALGINCSSLGRFLAGSWPPPAAPPPQPAPPPQYPYNSNCGSSGAFRSYANCQGSLGGQGPHEVRKLSQGERGGSNAAIAGASAGATTRSAASTTAAASTSTVPGTGQTIGLLEFDGFNPQDVKDFLTLIGAAPALIDNISTVPVNGGVTTPGANQDEVLIDINTVLTIAPGATIKVFTAPFTGQPASYSAMFNAMINSGVTVISNSWASCENQVSAADAQGIDAVLQTAAASGISVFNGTGDSGSTCLDGGQNTAAVPADSPSATAVGGTTLNVGPGFTYGSETWWDGSATVPQSGQGGYGVSKFFSRPSYQNGLSAAPMRSLPDVAITADPATTGMVICEASNGGCPNGLLYGGTSMAAPAWAAYAALINAAQGKNLGAYNPVLYPLANTSAFHTAASMSSDFAHVGLGSPNVDKLNLALAKQSAGPVDPGVSGLAALEPVNSIIAASTSVPADGSTTAGVMVFLRDANGHAISGKTVTLTASGGNAVFSPASVVTDVTNGAAIFTVTDKTVESVTFSATDSTDGVALTQTQALTFGVPPATSANLSVFPTTVTADNSSAATLTVLAKDALGRPTPGKVITIGQGNGHSVIKGPTPSVTDSTGQIQFTATDDQNETVTYTATDVTDGNLAIPGTGTVTFSSAGSSDCTANPAVGANGYVVTTFASNFPASDFFFSDINYSGCPGASSPFFGSSGSVVITDFNTGDVYQTGVLGGAVSSSDVIANLGESVGTPVLGKDGSLYAARYGTNGSFSSGDVIQLDPTTFAIVREVATNLTCPAGLVVDPISGDLFFDDQCSGAGSDNPSVFRVAAPSSTNPTVSTYATLPVPGGQQGLAFAPNGTLYAISGGSGNTAEVVSVTGTNSATPGTVTVLTGITPDSGTLNIGQANADGSAKTLLLHVPGDNGGSLETVDITTSPPTVAEVLATGDIGAGLVGPDGCYYVGAHHVVYKLAPSSSACTLTPTAAGASLALSPATVSPNPAQGTAQTFTATLANATPLSGVPVFFRVSGANPQVKLGTTDAKGNAVLTYVASQSGTDTVVATATGVAAGKSTSTILTSNAAQVNWAAGKHATFVGLNAGPTGGVVDQPVSVSASLTDVSAIPAAALGGQSITFVLGGSSCTAATNAAGLATCALTPAAAGTATLTASFAGSSALAAATQSVGFLVSAASTPAPTVSIAVSPATVAAGTAANLTWSSTNATACVASGAWSGSEATAGTLRVTPATNGTSSYTLTCTGAGGSGAATAVLAATLVAVTVTAKSGGGAIDGYALLFLAALAILRLLMSPPRPRRVHVVALLSSLIVFAAVDVVRADSPAAAASDSASALDPLYVGLRVGAMPVRQDGGRIDQGLASRGFGEVTASSETAGTAGTLFVGYEFAPHTALELGYTFREATAARLSGNLASAAALTPLLQNTTALIRGYGNIVSLSYAGRFDVLPRVSLQPRLGGFFWATKVSAVGFDDRVDATHEGGGVTAGVTAAYRVWRGLELGVSIDHYRGFPSNLATLYAGTLVWRFGG
jgi:hypothetical protein